VNDHGGLGRGQAGSNLQPLDDVAAMRLLASVDYGRVVFTLNALPAIRPVNHLVDGGRIVIRTRLTSALSGGVRAAEDVVVAYQADCIDPESRTGWSVVVTGLGHALTDPEQVRRYERLLQPWVNHADTVIAITPQIISGLRIDTMPNNNTGHAGR
jgi:hypothetical protein